MGGAPRETPRGYIGPRLVPLRKEHFVKTLRILVILLVIVFLSVAALSCAQSASQDDLRKAEEARVRAEEELAKTKKELAELKAKVAELEAGAGESQQAGSDSSNSRPSSSSGSSALHTPAKGSAERQAILDAVRAKINWSKLFKVQKLNVKGDWAYAILQQHDPADPSNSYESFSALLNKVGGAWKCLWAVGGSDGVSIEEQTGLTIPKYLQKKYPDAPAEIF
ncbi:MAG: hypothetical protein C4521_13355 [Actinobacteria bacterium]|nr:MAG: hypothetical protein C4521_13355 [Actinomycetota bacterium]